MIVRYVIGSLNLLDAFISLGPLLLFTMLLAAVALMISAQNAHRPRFSLFRIIVVLLLGVPVANQLLVFVFLGFSQFFGPFTSVFNSAFSIMVLIYTLLVLLLLLEFAASHISRPAENHAYIKRALGILALTMGWIFHVSTTDHAWLIHISIGAYLLIICVNALCEDPVDLQSLYAPFLQGNLWKRCLRMWLYPGWPSGIIYTLSICVLFFATMPPPPHTTPYQMVPASLIVAAGLCLPLVFSTIMWPHLRQKWWLYLLVQAVLFIGSMAIVHEAPRHNCLTLYGTDYVASLLPLSPLVRAVEPSKFCPVYPMTTLASIGIFLLLAWPWWRAWRHIRDIESRTHAALEEHRQHV